MSGLALEDIEDLYSRYAETILVRCRLLLRDEHRAWDAMHRTFVIAIKKRSSYRGDGEAISWLYTIATRTCLDELRAGKRAATEPSVERGDRGTQAGTLADRHTVSRLLARFPRRVQEIVVLRFFDELEVQEIAARTGLSQRTVARRLRRFLDKARTILTADSA